MRVPAHRHSKSCFWVFGTPFLSVSERIRECCCMHSNGHVGKSEVGCRQYCCSVREVSLWPIVRHASLWPMHPFVKRLSLMMSVWDSRGGNMVRRAPLGMHRRVSMHLPLPWLEKRLQIYQTYQNDSPDKYQNDPPGAHSHREACQQYDACDTRARMLYHLA